jgi:uroporphyrinogen decarboxylase
MNSRFLDACRRRPTDVRPVWFMRQAGRYLRQYREMRSRHSILEIAKRPDLAAAATLQPVEILDVDAAIIFADLLLPVEPMGLKLRYAQGEGPIIGNPVRTASDIDTLSTANTDELGYVGEAIQLVVRALGGKVPVIGFVGAPFTMASYMIRRRVAQFYPHQAQCAEETLCGGHQARSWTYWRLLLRQVAAGAQAIQVFDSWAGALVRRLCALRRALFAR